MYKPILTSRKLLVGLLLTSVFFVECRKTENDVRQRAQTALIAQAKAFVLNDIQSQLPVFHTDNPRNDRTRRTKDMNWASAGVISFRGQPAVLVPVHYSKDIFVKTTWGGNNCFRLDNQVRLLVYRDSGMTWHAEMVTMLPDTSFLGSDQRRFSGVVLVDDFWGNPLNKYRYARDGAILRYVPDEKAALRQAPRQMAASVRTEGITEICSYIYGYNYAVGDEDNGVSWVEFGGCSIMYVPDDGGSYYGSIGAPGGAGGGGAAPPPPPVSTSTMPTIFKPTHVITDIGDYLKCFQNIPGATFQVTLCVEQPSPGSRNPWVISFTDGSSGSGGSSAGHSYLVMTEIMPNGRYIIRSVGFYPSTKIYPSSAPVPGVLNNDETSPFNIAAQYNINGTLFFSMLQYINGAASANYQINTFNCTNFVLDALDAGHIYLPHTLGYWIGGMGVDPGDLGEDIRNYDFTGMTRITTPFLHGNIGTCD